MGAIHQGVEMARVDLIRAGRKYADKPLQVAILGGFLLMLVGGGGYLAARLGGGLVGTDTVLDGVSLIVALRGAIAVIWLIGIVVFAVRIVGQRGTLEGAEGLLTVVPTRSAVVGLVLSELGYLLAFALPAGIAVGAGLASATGWFGFVVTVPVAVAVGGIGAVAVGVPVGLAVRHVVTRLPFVARHKSWLVVAVFVAYFVALTTGTIDRLVVALFEPMQVSPAGWLADLMVIGGGVAADPLRALGAVALTSVALPFGVAGATAVANRHWFSDPVLAGESESDPATPTQATARPRYMQWLARLFGRPTTAIVVLAWRRAGRAPLKLLYAAYPLLFLAGVIADIVQTGRVPPYLPYGLLVFVAWAAGVIFTLNPIGDQGAVLPATLLSGLSGRAFVRGQVLAGLIVALPVGTALTAAVALLSPLPIAEVALVTAATPVVMVLSSVLAVGVGTAFPRFESVNITRSMSAVIPSMLGFVLFSSYLFATAAVAVLTLVPDTRPIAAVVVSVILGTGLSVDAAVVGLVAGGALVVFAILPLVSYRYAVGRFDSYTID